MNYWNIISYIYVIAAFVLSHIYYHNNYNNGYYDKNKKETIGIIKNFYCYDKNSCYSDIEYIIDDVKYLHKIDTPNNLKIGDKVKLKYNPAAPNDVNDLRVYNNHNNHHNLLIIFIILLWIFLFIIIVFQSIYNKFIFLIYAIIATLISSYLCIILIHNNYNDYNYDKNLISLIIIIINIIILLLLWIFLFYYYKKMI